MVTQFTDSACGVDDRSILTFSQSENPNSPHFADQTRMFSNKEWVDPPFCEAEVLAEPGLETEKVCDAPPCAAAGGAGQPATGPQGQATKPRCKVSKQKKSAQGQGPEAQAREDQALRAARPLTPGVRPRSGGR